MTTATAICTQPGCGGTVEDGYCMTCGLAAAPPQAPGSAAPGSAGSGSAGSGSPIIARIVRSR